MATVKVTKKDYFNALHTLVENTEDVSNKTALIDFIDNELALLAKKASSAKSKPSKAQTENENLKTAIIANLSKAEKALTITEFQTAYPDFAEYSNQKLSALFKQLVDAGKVEKTVVKKKSYFSVPVVDEQDGEPEQSEDSAEQSED